VSCGDRFADSQALRAATPAERSTLVLLNYLAAFPKFLRPQIIQQLRPSLEIYQPASGDFEPSTHEVLQDDT
jgi:hypothetical protein